jgi:hypothetical protein
MLLYRHVMLDVLHDQDLYLLFGCNVYVLQFRILADRYNLFDYNMMRSCVEYFDDYDHVLFHAMYEIRQQVFDYELMLLHDRQVNEHHAMDNHFDWMNAMDHVVMMMI